MQGFERIDREFTDAGLLAGHLVPGNSMFAFLAAHRAEVFPDADYADLFAPPGFGRPSLPATRMAAVLALQTLYDYSDSALLGAPYTSRHATYDLRRLRRKQVIERLPPALTATGSLPPAARSPSCSPRPTAGYSLPGSQRSAPRCPPNSPAGRPSPPPGVSSTTPSTSTSAPGSPPRDT